MFKTILLPVDLGEDSSWIKALPAALHHARSHGSSHGSSLTVLTVVPDFGKGVVGAYFPPDFADRAVASAENDLRAFCAAHVPADVPVTPLVRYGTIYHQIIDVADEIEADLIVMASHRPALRDTLLGPNAERVMRHAPLSVLVVRS